MRRKNDLHLREGTPQEKECVGKIGFLTLEAAKRAAKTLHKKQKLVFNVYTCSQCGKIHVGRRNPRYVVRPLIPLG